MESYLLEIRNIAKIRLKARMMTTLRSMVREEVITLTHSDKFSAAMREHHFTEDQIKQFYEEIPDILADLFIKEKASQVKAVIPELLIKETQILKAELTEVVDSAAKEAGKELIEELFKASK